jgi:cysteine desulfurase
VITIQGYFDHCATTPPFPEVIRSVTEAMERYYGNASSIHRIGLEAEQLLKQARGQMAQLLQIDSDELIMTSGGTESNNLAVKGIAKQYQSRGRHIVTTEIEHPSVIEACKQLEAEGYTITYLPVDDRGIVRLTDIERAVTEETILVSIMAVNNEVGSIQPISEIGRFLKRKAKAFFHVDAVQAIGKLPIHPAAAGIDLLSASAHKFRGPKGIGFLYRRKGISLYPLIVGGGQEWQLRAGTSNVPLVAGMAKAMRMSTEKTAVHLRHTEALKNALLDRLQKQPDIVVNGSVDPRYSSPYILNLSFPGLRAEVVVHSLEQYGFYVSTRSACSSGKQTPSKVLLAMGCGEERAVSSIRISLSHDHSMNDIQALADAIEKISKELDPSSKGEASL